MLLWDTDREKPPLKGVTPHGAEGTAQYEGNRRQAVEGFFREIFYMM